MDEKIDEIQGLADLHASGALTDEEFAAQSKRSSAVDAGFRNALLCDGVWITGSG